MTTFRRYKMCLTLGNSMCSEAFSFDSVRKEYSKADNDDYQSYNFDNDDYDYKERITTSRDKKEDYVELNLNNMEIFTNINIARNSNNRDMTKDSLDTTPHNKNFHQKLDMSSEKDDSEDAVNQILKEKKMDQNQESENVSQNIKRDRIMLVLGRIVELCLIMLVIVSTILCVFLLCAIKFC